MSRITTVLACCYMAAAGVLLHFGGTARNAGRYGYAAVFGVMAVLFVAAAVHHAYHREELRDALARLEHTARPTTAPPPAAPPGPGCCETWWATAGAEHDPKHCTRKDQTL
ncbi:hypothetical protein [Streptomyces sp. NPDC059224]|uniref:hypothetical protein n=1 Tax=Streptomyces sp. NPDC059224 TaxID=3346775 RepID=UPI00367B9F9B